MIEMFLGDGVYAAWDGFQFRLRAAREGGDHEVFLDLPTYNNFIEYAERILKNADG
jgi:hypothetical protein